MQGSGQNIGLDVWVKTETHLCRSGLDYEGQDESRNKDQPLMDERVVMRQMGDSKLRINP